MHMCAAVFARMHACFCVSAPQSASGSLLVCRIDSLRTFRYRLYLSLNDPPERVMREHQRGGRTEGENGVSEGQGENIRRHGKRWTRFDGRQTQSAGGENEIGPETDGVGRINIGP